MVSNRRARSSGPAPNEIIEKWSKSRNKITIGSLLQQTKDAKQVIEDRNRRHKKGTGKTKTLLEMDSNVSGKLEPSTKGDTSVGESYAPYDKLARYQQRQEKLNNLRQQQEQHQAPVRGSSGPKS